MLLSLFFFSIEVTNQIFFSAPTATFSNAFDNGIFFSATETPFDGLRRPNTMHWNHERNLCTSLHHRKHPRNARRPDRKITCEAGINHILTSPAIGTNARQSLQHLWPRSTQPHDDAQGGLQSTPPPAQPCPQVHLGQMEPTPEIQWTRPNRKRSGPKYPQNICPGLRRPDPQAPWALSHIHPHERGPRRSTNPPVTDSSTPQMPSITAWNTPVPPVALAPAQRANPWMKTQQYR